MNPVHFQRLEGLAIFVVATWVYFDQGYAWWLYPLLLFAFDISMLGYVANNRIGAFCYNLGHSLIIPSALLLVYFLDPYDPLLVVTLLWFAHIGMDRAFGYGLKQEKGFKHTHLGVIGK